jgi:thiamine biosynthesis lipoprotein ApbE
LRSFRGAVVSNDTLEFHYALIETEATPESWHDYIVSYTEGGPLDLASICDLCATAKVKAKLMDEAGFTRGFVDVTGNWRVTA